MNLAETLGLVREKLKFQRGLWRSEKKEREVVPQAKMTLEYKGIVSKEPNRLRGGRSEAGL